VPSFFRSFFPSIVAVATPRALKLLLFGVEHTARAYHPTDMITSGYGLVRFNGPITFHVVPFITRYHKYRPSREILLRVTAIHRYIILSKWRYSYSFSTSLSL